MIIRRGLHQLGFRFRLHDRRLPGTPDLVLSRYKAVVFVHGCFWHRHDCRLFKMPATRTEFWTSKFDRNQANDSAAMTKLLGAGWRVATVWECALRGTREASTEIPERLGDWLKGNSPTMELRG